MSANHPKTSLIPSRAASLALWAFAVFFAVSVAMMLSSGEPPAISLDDGLGPEVVTESL